MSPTGTAPELVFTPEALAPTGAATEPLPTGLALVLVGLVLVLASRRGKAGSTSRKH